MSSSPLTSQVLLERHQSRLKDHKPIPLFSELVPTGKAPRILIISCADPRCIPENIFNLQTAEAVVVRVAGGNAQFVLNHLLSIDSLVHFTEVLIVQHTDCGATMFRDNAIKQGLKSRAPSLEAEIEAMEFGEITGTLQENVKKSMLFLQRSAFVPEALKSKVRGFVFDIQTGELDEVAV